MENKKHLEIVLDFDSTYCDTHNAVLELYREDTGDFSTVVDDENLIWNMHGICPLWNSNKIEEVFVNPRLFHFMKPLKNAKEILEKQKSDGSIFITVCSMHKQQGIKNKYDWILNNMPFVDSICILPTELYEKFDKSSVTGDIIIDDRIDALNSSKCRYKICFGNYTWNKEWYGLRAGNWEEVDIILNKIKQIEGIR